MKARVIMDKMNFQRRRQAILAIFAMTVILSVVAAAKPIENVTTKYLFNLSDFSGPLQSQWASLFVDEASGEVYVIDPWTSGVSVFNPNGMEIYRFADDNELGKLLSGIYLDHDVILFLAQRDQETRLVRCNFRGEEVAETAIAELPAEFEGFSPNRMVAHDGRLYLADIAGMKVVITDESGRFITGYNLLSTLKLPDERKAAGGMFGFCVAADGSILFTMPTLFKAFQLSPDGKLISFGEPGSSRGKFGLASGIATDERGYIFVTDRLRCVTLIFDRAFHFLSEYGYRGYGPENLIAPNDIAVSRDGKIYIAQAGMRGISVYQLTVQPSPDGAAAERDGSLEKGGSATDQNQTEVIPLVIRRLKRPPIDIAAELEKEKANSSQNRNQVSGEGN